MSRCALKHRSTDTPAAGFPPFHKELRGLLLESQHHRSLDAAPRNGCIVTAVVTGHYKYVLCALDT